MTSSVDARTGVSNPHRQPETNSIPSATTTHRMALGEPLAPDVFAEIRREMELSHCKWDSQVGDVTTLARFPLIMSRSTWRDLSRAAEALTLETLAAEHELANRPDLFARVALPRSLGGVMSGARAPVAARILRFDFHWTTHGWRISEVNSDVPGGFTEASSFTRLVAQHVGLQPAGDPTCALVDAMIDSAGGDLIAFVNAPGHMEDHQIAAYLVKRMRQTGFPARACTLGELEWRAGHAFLCGARVGAIFRFYQTEWLANLKRSMGWQRLFDGQTPVCNPGTAALTESKRFPLVWDQLATPLPNWRRYLPETRSIRHAPWALGDDWLLKPAYCNTGERILLRSSMSRRDWLFRSAAVRARSRHWIAQRRFEAVSLGMQDEVFLPCIGVYTVNGQAAGAYARIARGPVIDGTAQDVALLIGREA